MVTIIFSSELGQFGDEGNDHCVNTIIVRDEITTGTGRVFSQFNCAFVIAAFEWAQAAAVIQNVTIQLQRLRYVENQLGSAINIRRQRCRTGPWNKRLRNKTSY